MSGFIRRYGFTPGVETITLIEGVIIVDLPPPGAITGKTQGTVACVGEFPDMTNAVAVSNTGVVTTLAQPVEVFSGQDMLDKVGGFDSTLGNFGLDGGNGFAALRNKKFARLICVPINLACSAAGRAWRDLPTNAGAALAQPVVPLQGGRVEAGRRFINGTSRVQLAKRVQFTALGHYKGGTDGAITAAGAPAATQVFNSVGGAFLTAYNGGPIPKGHILVLGQIGGVGALGANAATYRVQVQAASNTALTVEKLDGTTFDWSTGVTQPYRIHPQTDADTGGTVAAAALADTVGYTLPARTLDATIAAGLSCTPTIVPTAGTASSWDPLSGLTLRSHVSTGFVYVSGTQAPNAVTDVGGLIEAFYATAIDALLLDAAPARDVNIVFSARTSATIRTKLKTHELVASGAGIGRIAVVSPPLTTVSTTAACADASPGVGATRDESVIYCWPGGQTFVPEAAGITLNTADGLTTSDGMLDDRGDGWMASVLSNLPPERNPGQSGPPVDTVLAPVAGLQRGLVNLGVQDYTALRAAGIAGLRIDRVVGPIFQSGVTSSLVAGKKNINRRRMANYIQDSVAARLVQFAKQPLTQSLKDDITGEIDTFLNLLKSPNNPPAQRIVDYVVDDKSGNTPALNAAGIYVVIGRVKTLSTADFIVFQTEVGEGVTITTT